MLYARFEKTKICDFGPNLEGFGQHLKVLHRNLSVFGQKSETSLSNLKVVKISKRFSYIVKGFCQNSDCFGLYLDGFYQNFKSLDKSLGYWLKVRRIWSNSKMC